MNKNNQNIQIEVNEIHEDIHELFGTAKEISLTPEEKRQGAIDFHNFMKENPNGETSILSPYVISAFRFVKQRQVVMVALVLFLILGGAGGTVLAAKSSLPGDLLYTIKINVNEKLEMALAVDTESQARVAVKHAIERIEEVEKLAMEDKIDESNQESIKESLALQSKKASENILKLKVEGNIDAAIGISSDFENSLSNHKKNLEDIAQSKKAGGKTLLTKTRESIHDNLLASAKVRLVLESNLSSSSQILISKKAATNELNSSRKKLKNIEVLVKKSYDIDEETKNDLRVILNTVTESEEKINVGAYGNAVVLLQDVKLNTNRLEEKFKKTNTYTAKTKPSEATAVMNTFTPEVNSTTTATTSVNITNSSTATESASVPSEPAVINSLLR